MLNLFLVYQFIRRLATPFNEWEAYKLGIIDERGNVLKKRKDLRTVQERNAFGAYDVMILNLKKLLEKIPGGQSRLASYAAALYLLREWNHFTTDSLLNESVSDIKIQLSADSFINGYSDYTILENYVNPKNAHLTEIFDKSYKYKQAGKRSSGPEGNKYQVLSYFFVTNDLGTVEVSIEGFGVGSKKEYWAIEFDKDGSLEKSNQGDQYRIFATVIEIIKSFVAEYEPKSFSFMADKDADNSSSREKLYDAMVARFARSSGYKQTIRRDPQGSEYTLIKEEGPAVNVGSGAIAGLGVGPDGEPGLTRAQQRRYKTKNVRGKKLRDIIGKT